jgi:hypothetical protein
MTMEIESIVCDKLRHSPTFVATFNDGEVTRMTVYQGRDDGRLDVGRGVRLARHAYCSRKHTETPPPIKAAHYEDGETGAVLKCYSTEDLKSEEEQERASTTKNKTGK